MSVQRRRGVPIRISKEKQVTDRRGNQVMVPDLDNWHETNASIAPRRGSRAELPGYQAIDVYVITIPVLDGIGLWSRVEWDGKQWDVIIPPQYHHGLPRTRHYSMEIRERPSDG